MNPLKKIPQYLVCLLLITLFSNMFFSDKVLCLESDGQMNIEFVTEKCQINSNNQNNLLKLSPNNQHNDSCSDIALQNLVFIHHDKLQYNYNLQSSEVHFCHLEDLSIPTFTSIVSNFQEASHNQFSKQIKTTILLI